VLVNIVLESLRDPIWQVGEGILALATLMLLFALRNPEVGVSVYRKRQGTRFLLGVGLTLFLLLSGGVVLSHRANTPPTRVSEAPLSAWTPSLLPKPSPSPTPSPLPTLTPSTAQVLTTFCDAINRKDANTAWKQLSVTLQQERTAHGIPPGRMTIVHCGVSDISDQSVSGILLLRTVDVLGSGDGYDRPFLFTLRVEDGAWKIAQIARCLSDGCLDETPLIVP
jgi:hypothetical protein